MKKLILILAVLFVPLLFAVGTYFLLDEFTTDDAAPLTDPITTSGGQSVDVVDVEGVMSVSGGVLNVPTQASAADGEEGLRYATEATEYAGRTVFFKVSFSSLTNSTLSSAGGGATEENNASLFLGYNGAEDVAFSTNLTAAVRVNGTPRFLWPFAERVTGVGTSMTAATITIPTTTDSFYIAVSLGGRDGGDDQTSIPWYSGVDPSGYTDGGFLWIKKNVGGQWILQGCANDVHQAAQYAALANLTSAFTVDRWAVSNDTLRSLMQPVQYHSGTGTDGVQLFDDAPEVGASFDSLSGNFIFASNFIVGTGADPGAPLFWSTTYTGSDDDVYAELIVNMTDVNDDVGIILRRDPADGTFVMAIFARAASNCRIMTFDGVSTFTTQATSASANYTAGQNVVGVAIMDSNVVAWMGGATECVSAAWTGTTALTNIGLNNHGFRTGDTSTDIKEFRVYPIGTDNEYSSLDAYFGLAVAANSKKKRALGNQ